MEDEEPVYFVMGSDTECKTNVAITIAWGLGAASNCETSKAGVRTFSRQPESAPVVVDTVPFQNSYFEDSDWLRFARTWISMNSLRRMFGRRVKLVCVVNSSPPVDYLQDKYCHLRKVSWVSLLAYSFKGYGEAKYILVNSVDTRACADRRLVMGDLLQKAGIPPSDIVLANLSRRGLPVPPPGHLGRRQDFEPFLLREVSSRRIEAWAPERVILFGKTGSGKSTLAEMLISGRLVDCPSRRAFQIGSGIRGATRKVINGEGRGWFVVDTPGFGEPKEDEHSSTATDVAQKKIHRYVQIVDGFYSHYLYLVKKDRIDKLEPRLWQFFLKLFGEKLLFHFTVVITDADDDWLDENIGALKETFDGCESFVSVDFPSVKRDDDEWEAENKKTRAASLNAIEEELASLKRYDAFSDLGRFSNWVAKAEVASLNGNIRVVKGYPKKLASMIRAGALWAYADLRRLISLLVQDDKIVLVPLVDEDEHAELLPHHAPDFRAAFPGLCYFP